MRIAPALLSVVLPSCLPAVASADPSFNCAAATQTDENAICADPVPSAIDSIVTRAFAAYRPSFGKKPQVARDLLKDRAGCGEDRACIAAVQSGSLSTFTYENDEFHQPPPWVETYATALMGHKATRFAGAGGESAKVMPAKPGECVRTRVTSITTRFGEPVTYENQDQGTAIAFDNGGYQVSYGRGDEFYNVAAGDETIVCLMSIPHDCPAGDERGRVYYTLDRKTQTQWVLADSQHLCGGA